MNTEEGNKLIANFMGKEYCEAWCSCPKEDMCKENHIGLLKYHDSWDLLMPVVEKIDSMREGAIWSDPWGCVKVLRWRKQQDSKHYSMINKPAIKNVNKKDPIKAFWKSCVEFIQWYNKENYNPLDHTPTIEESPYLYKRKEIHV